MVGTWLVVRLRWCKHLLKRTHATVVVVNWARRGVPRLAATVVFGRWGCWRRIAVVEAIARGPELLPRVLVCDVVGLVL